nr:MAG TPA_asm: hypothetical protein [Caudoviricetes sp.]
MFVSFIGATTDCITKIEKVMLNLKRRNTAKSVSYCKG